MCVCVCVYKINFINEGKKTLKKPCTKIFKRD